MRSLTGNCKFRDCAHQSEPDCAIQEAVANGQINPQRLESYFQILQTLQNS
jgi:ribosome biogenesis GTPase